MGLFVASPHLGDQICQKPQFFKRNVQNIEICILSKLLHRFQPNFAQQKRPPSAHRGWSKYGLTNPRWRTAAILKTAKSPYLSNRSTEFNEIWHVVASWPTTRYRPITFRGFENPRWRWPPSSKSQENRDITATD